MKRRAIVTLAVTLTLGVAAPAIAGAKPAPPGSKTTTTTVTNGGRHFK